MGGKVIKSKREHIINDDIMVDTCRLIGPTNEQLGVVSISEARRKAEDFGLDLMLISQAKDQTPAVCRILNYGKFRYEEDKRFKENKKKEKEKAVETKTAQITYGMSEYDMSYRLKKALSYSHPTRLKVSMMLRGRELGNVQRAIDVCNKFCQMASEGYNIEKPAYKEGRFIIAILNSKPILPLVKNNTAVKGDAGNNDDNNN